MSRILVIEDDPDTRLLLEDSLRGAGYEVIAVSNGKQGVEMMNPFRAAPARVIITDIFMPEKTGIQVIAELRRRFPEVAIIAITGNPEFGNSLAVARRLGADKTLVKPFQPDDIVAAVKEVLAQREAGPNEE